MTTIQLEPPQTIDSYFFDRQPASNGRASYAPAEPFDINDIITEDDEPVDNLFSEKQQRLLTSSLYDSAPNLSITKPFLAAANVGVFFEPRQPPIVPDVFLSLGVKVAEDWYAKEHRSYFVWQFGKVPEVVVEIVSNKVGREDARKLNKYAQYGIPYYVIYDPTARLSQQPLRAYQLTAQRTYQLLQSPIWFAEVGLGIRLWSGEFEGVNEQWLRWYDHTDQVVPTGAEIADQERQAKLMAQEQADQERQAKLVAQAQAERDRRAKLLAQEQADQERHAKLLAQEQADQERHAKLVAQEQAEQERLANEAMRQKLAEYEAKLKALGIS